MRGRIVAAGAVLLGLALAGCGGGGLDQLGSATQVAGPTDSATPHETRATRSSTPDAGAPREDERTYCTVVMRGQQVSVKSLIDLVERGATGMADSAQSERTLLVQDIDQFPRSVTAHLNDEAAVLRQIANGEPPDLDRFHAAADAINTLCDPYL